ncbi:MAG: hypothetical protein HP024_03570 [Acholeplasmatales bacterium]|jgi:hypothetical protein|nr:hypothetical protein [Acholeplasmatales bacterium]
MYIKIYYQENNNNVEKLRAVDRNNKEINLEYKSIIGCPLTEGLKRQLSNLNKGYFVTSWVRE